MRWSIKNLGLVLLGMLVLQLVPGVASANNSGVLCAGANTTLIGESLRQNSEGCIEVIDWSWGGENSGAIDSALGGGGAGKVAFEPFSFSKNIDTSSEDLLRSMAQASRFPNLEYKEFRDCQSCQQPEPYLTIKFEDVYVASHRLSGIVGDLPSEVVELLFNRVEFCYSKTNPQDGSLETPQCFGWDIARNQQL